MADNGDHIVYPAGENNDCETSTLVPNGQRCKCRMRLAFNFQCEHEMCIDGKLILEKYDTRWLSQRCYDTLAPTSSLQSFNREENPEDRSLVPNQTFHDGDDNDSENDEVPNQDVLEEDINTCEENEDNMTLSYRSILPQAEILVCLLQSDKDKLSSLSRTLTVITERARKGQSINVSFDTCTSREASSNDENNDPLQAILLPMANAVNHKRYKSVHENRRNHGRRQHSANEKQPSSSDLDHVRIGRPKTKSCSACRQPKHQIGSCPKLHQYKKPPLAYGDMSLRHKIQEFIRNPSHYETSPFQELSGRPVSSTLPKHISGVVIHNRYYLTAHRNEMALECTILGQQVEEMTGYKHYLFSIGCISAYITKGKYNHIINELIESPQNDVPTTVPTQFPQNFALNEMNFSQTSNNQGDHLQAEYQQLMSQPTYYQSQNQPFTGSYQQPWNSGNSVYGTNL
eukprot:scaffold54980_cov45-Attheya_sp.AAC.4